MSQNFEKRRLISFNDMISVRIQFSFQTSLENFLEDEELAGLINGLITDIGPEAVSIIWEEIKEIYDKPIEDVIKKKIYFFF